MCLEEFSMLSCSPRQGVGLGRDLPGARAASNVGCAGLTVLLGAGEAYRCALKRSAVGMGKREFFFFLSFFLLLAGVPLRRSALRDRCYAWLRGTRPRGVGNPSLGPGTGSQRRVPHPRPPRPRHAWAAEPRKELHRSPARSLASLSRLLPNAGEVSEPKSTFRF